MDVFVLPSYREGFGMSVIEASAMEVPVIVTEYPGPSCAMINGETGVSVAIKDCDGLYFAISTLLKDQEKRISMGKAGRVFVKANFEQGEFRRQYVKNRLGLLKYEI